MAERWLNAESEGFLAMPLHLSVVKYDLRKEAVLKFVRALKGIRTRGKVRQSDLKFMAWKDSHSLPVPRVHWEKTFAFLHQYPPLPLTMVAGFFLTRSAYPKPIYSVRVPFRVPSNIKSDVALVSSTPQFFLLRLF